MQMRLSLIGYYSHTAYNKVTVMTILMMMMVVMVVKMMELGGQGESQCFLF